MGRGVRQHVCTYPGYQNMGPHWTRIGHTGDEGLAGIWVLIPKYGRKQTSAALLHHGPLGDRVGWATDSRSPLAGTDPAGPGIVQGRQKAREWWTAGQRLLMQCWSVPSQHWADGAR